MLHKLMIICLILNGISNGVIVELPTGKILGRQDISLKRNVTFYTFLQIPYGRPPIGKLRFMPPRPVENWHGTLNCTQNTKICYQVGQNDDRGTEDCLYLNVYTPVEPGQNASLSVMFYIFGGGFYEGNALFSEYGPHYFMEEEVVIVTVSYRLGPFGFLSTNDEVILGNAGLKDQNLALKWVQKNIHLFGGDPKKVTIFGNSAGAASVSCHILSQKSVGLFRAGIGQSGSSLTIWSYARSARSVAYQMAADINSSFNNDSSSEELLNFLQNVNASELNAVLTKFTIYVSNEQGLEGSSYFGVVVEPDVEDAFITSLMYESIANGNFTKVPIMLGICSEESLYRAESIGDLKNFIEYIEADSASLVVSDFHIKDINRKRLVGNLTRKIYTDGLFIDDLPAALKFFSDTSICRSAIRHAQLQSNYTDVYFYQFSYHGQLGQNDIYVEGADRVYHTEDMKYLWCSNNVSNIAEYYPQSDVTTLERYVRLFTNFAKYLNPTPKPEDLLQNIAWPKLVPNNLTYLNINTTLEIKENPKAASYGKFVDLYDKYAVKPLDTY